MENPVFVDVLVPIETAEGIVSKGSHEGSNCGSNWLWNVLVAACCNVALGSGPALDASKSPNDHN